MQKLEAITLGVVSVSVFAENTGNYLHACRALKTRMAVRTDRNHPDSCVVLISFSKPTVLKLTPTLKLTLNLTLTNPFLPKTSPISPISHGSLKF